jgi:hypothetical protein
MTGSLTSPLQIKLASNKTPSIYVPAIIVILSATILQKVCIPGVSNSIAVGTIIVPFVAVYALAVGALNINMKAFIIFSCLTLVGVVSVYINSADEKISTSAMFLLLFVQSPFIFSVKNPANASGRIIEAFRDTMYFISIGGIIQFILQFIIGSQYAYFIDYQFPSWLVMKGFTNINPVSYGSSILKSNGIFFLEPSFFGQFLAVGAILEILTKQRLDRLTVYIGALICSFSGTGIVTLGLFGFYLILKQKNFVLIGFLALLFLVVYIFGDMIGIEAITSRTNELTTPGSSGHLRFITPFQLIDRYVFSNLSSLLFGRGPGAFANYQDSLEYGATDATWSKILLEYGFLGLTLYVSFIASSIAKYNNPLLFPLLFIYTFLGGYATNAAVVAVILVMLVWSRGVEVKDKQQVN